MPKLEIYDDKNTPEKGEPVRLKLFERDNSVMLAAVNKHGDILNSGRLIRIHPDGSVERMYAVNSALGFRLNSRSQLPDRG